VLGLVIAGFFGAGDFFGGLSAKRTNVVNVVALSHLVGLFGVGLLAPLIADEFRLADFGIGALAGLAGGFGVGLLYQGLARGPMAVVAPLTAITSAAVPAAWGVVGGESFTGWTWAGIAIALIAIAMISMPAEDQDEVPVTAKVVLQSLAAGVGFGTMFILLDLTDPVAAPWPVVGARVATTTLLFSFLLVRRPGALATAASVKGPLILTGLFDTGSNALFLYATQQGSLAIVSVLSSLYPAATVLLARFVLSERMSERQVAGMAAALLAAVLIALGSSG